MVGKTIKKVYLYTRFERFWHWLQGLMIMVLMVTGFEVHGTFTLMGFQTRSEERRVGKECRL